MNKTFPQMLQKYNITADGKSLSQRLVEPNRFEEFSAQFGDLLLDFSRTGLNRATLSQLLELAEVAGVEQARERLFNAEDINFTENRPATSILHFEESIMC